MLENEDQRSQILKLEAASIHQVAVTIRVEEKVALLENNVKALEDTCSTLRGAVESLTSDRERMEAVQVDLTQQV